MNIAVSDFGPLVESTFYHGGFVFKHQILYLGVHVGISTKNFHLNRLLNEWLLVGADFTLSSRAKQRCCREPKTGSV